MKTHPGTSARSPDGTMPPLRRWQASAVDQFVAGAHRGLKDQLAYVTPGGGKTRFALEVGSRLIDSKEIRRLCVVVHTHNLREQWIEAAAKFGLVLTDTPIRDRDSDGFVVTYQQLVLDQEKLDSLII